MWLKLLLQLIPTQRRSGLASFVKSWGAKWKWVLGIMLLLILVGVIVWKCKSTPKLQNPSPIVPSKIPIWQDSVKKSKAKIQKNESDRKAAVDSVHNLHDTDLQRAIDSNYNYPNR
jgi:hypothetical protein